MIVNKCDICGKISNVWRETNFSCWVNKDLKEIKQICLDCAENIEEHIHSMIVKNT